MSAELRKRLQWAGWHLLTSLLIAAAVAAVVFLVWFPHPYRVLSGGVKLFLIIVGVDVALGPLATFVVANAKKSTRELRMDVGIIALLQLGALVYGLWTVLQARPVYMAFEINRFRVVHAIDVDPRLLELAPPSYQRLPLAGPKMVAVRPFVNAMEKMEVTFAALQGVAIGARPDLWMHYEDAKADILAESKPVGELLERKLEGRQLIAEFISSHELKQDVVRYLPVAGRDEFWTVLLDGRTGEPLGYLGIDPY